MTSFEETKQTKGMLVSGRLTRANKRRRGRKWSWSDFDMDENKCLALCQDVINCPFDSILAAFISVYCHCRQSTTLCFLLLTWSISVHPHLYSFYFLYLPTESFLFYYKCVCVCIYKWRSIYDDAQKQQDMYLLNSSLVSSRLSQGGKERQEEQFSLLNACPLFMYLLIYLF